MDPALLTNMFHVGPAVSVLEKVLRPLIVYAFLVVGLRLAGKRELAQLNPFDLIVLLTLSNTLQNAIIGNDNSVTGGVIGGSTLLAVNYLVVRFLYKHESIDRVVEGAPDYLVRRGQIQHEMLEKELITMGELEAAARKQGIASLADVEEAILEPGGAIVFSAHEPVPEDVRHNELLQRFEALSQELRQLRGALDQR